MNGEGGREEKGREREGKGRNSDIVYASNLSTHTGVIEYQGFVRVHNLGLP